MVLTETGGNAASGVSDPFQGKWLTLSNTTLGALLASVNTSIILIALPDIFRGLRLDPLAPANTSYFLWMLMGYMLMTAVLVVSLGRLGDMFGRVKMYNLGFAVFAFFSILLSIDWMTGVPGALWLIIMRIFQGVGGALLFANSGAILTDAFPPHQRGLALGINQVTGSGGAFVLPPTQRGAGAGMAGTFQNSAQVLSIGIFFTLIIIGLAAHLPTALYAGLTAHGVPAATASAVSQLPPTGAMFAAFLGYNPMQTLLGTTTLAHLPHATAAYLTGRSFFPLLIAAPFMDGMRKAFTFAAIACVVAAIASWLRGGKYHYTEPEA